MYNREVLMCRPDYFEIAYSINPWMDTHHQPDALILEREYDALIEAHEATGRKIHFLDPVAGLPDMTYTANQALVRGKKAVLGNLPPQRAPETGHTRRWLEANGFEVVDCPYRFSGQGDAVPTGTGAVIKGREWRSDPRSDDFVRDFLGYEVIPIHTVSDRWYDDDLVVGAIRPGLIAVCLDALDSDSQARLKDRSDLELIPVSLKEAEHYALNLVSDGTTVMLAEGTPNLASELQRRGLQVVTRNISQLKLGGGGIRCTTLALDAN
jgi:N-dimethylarginine dimethylaminohydrolase